VDEERLDLVDQAGPEIVERLQMSVRRGVRGDGEASLPCGPGRGALS